MKIKFLFMAITSSVVLSSCYYDVESELYANETCNVPETVSFAADVQPIINSNCATSGCHVAGGTGTGNFESYDGVKAKVDDGSFVIEVFLDQTMPPSGNLGNCDSQILQAWIEADTPNN